MEKLLWLYTLIGCANSISNSKDLYVTIEDNTDDPFVIEYLPKLLKQIDEEYNVDELMSTLCPTEISLVFKDCIDDETEPFLKTVFFVFTPRCEVPNLKGFNLIFSFKIGGVDRFVCLEFTTKKTDDKFSYENYILTKIMDINKLEVALRTLPRMCCERL